MAKLAIYRGETLEREIELGPRTERIGRGDQNEIVLPDPAKSVSRFHAELRYENGRYTIVDLNSQNGTWVAGKRVAQTVLEPGVPVVVGTYRLVFVGDAEPLGDAEKTMIAGAPPAPRPVTPPAPPNPERAAAPAPPPAAKKEEPGPVAPPASAPKPVAAPPPAPAPKPAAAPPPPVAAPPPPAAPKPVAPPPPPPAPPAAAAPAPAPAAAKPAAPPPAPPKPAAPPPPPKPAPAPTPAVAAKPAEPVKPAAPKPAGKKIPTVAVLAVFVVLLLGAVAAGIFLWKPAGRAAPAPSPAAQAPSPVSSQPAAAQPAPGPAPEQQPAATPAAPPAAAERPKAEHPSIARTEPAPRAATAARAVPKEAAGGAAGEAAAVPAKKAGRRAAAEPAPAPARPRDLGAMLAQARSAMIKGDYLAAVSNLEAIVKVDPKYQDAAQMLDMAKSGARNAAQLAVDSGAKSEMAGDYDAAIKQYEQAQQLDPGSQPAADAMRRVRGRMQADGEDAFKRAKQFDALGRSSDAIAMYEKAIKLLPADHASTKTAKERLAALRGGE